jgi:hypothetical protein
MSLTEDGEWYEHGVSEHEEHGRQSDPAAREVGVAKDQSSGRSQAHSVCAA